MTAASSTTSLTPWLRQHLLETGALDPRLVGRKAQLRKCPTCRADILRGLDDDTCALLVVVDPTPLSPLGEALALVEGRYTVTFRRDRGHLVLDLRDDFHIAGSPAGTRAFEDVLRQHVCNTAPPAGPLATGSRHPAANIQEDYTGDPPF
jgi:hypothetical protein